MASITTIKQSHGSGQGLNDLLAEIVLPALFPNGSGTLEDAAVLETQAGRIAFTTDSFVVHPLEFAGGDIGKLAACGTINDLASMGAVPKSMSVSLICEEGLQGELLAKVLCSLRAVCDECGVAIVCGDTKVVEKGKADKLFINTSGIGTVPDGVTLSAANALPGDAVIVSGPIGQHGIAILARRQGLSFATEAISDCAPLSEIAHKCLDAAPSIRLLRDATRGGCAAVLNEIAQASNISIELKESDIPVSEVVRGACSFLGMDPLHIANEGRFVAVVDPSEAKIVIDVLHSHALGTGAAVIGRITEKSRFPVSLETAIGAMRPVAVPAGELLPRIC